MMTALWTTTLGLAPASASEEDFGEISADVGNTWMTLGEMGRQFVAALPIIGVGIAVFVLFWILAKLLRWTITNWVKRGSNYNLALVLARLGYAFTLLIGLLVAVTVVFPSVTPGRLISLLGIGGIAIGFAFQDIFQNLLAGILILLRQPFRVGDEIVSGDFTGTVESIETRATYIKTYDGRRVIIPNSQIYKEPVTVLTEYHMIRSEYDVGIGYGDDIGRAMEVALSVLKGVDGILPDPAPDVRVWDLAASTVNLRIRWWTDPTRANVVAVRSEVLRNIAQKMADAAIDLPFPTQVVLFHDQTEDADGDRTRQREGWPAGDNPPRPRSLAAVIEERDRRGADGKRSADAAP